MGCHRFNSIIHVKTVPMSKKNNNVKSGRPELHSLKIEGTEYETLFNKKFPPARPWKRPNQKEVLAFIPGTIQKVLVASGQTVNAGDILVVLEAMKMRNLVKSESSAVIKEVHVKEGDRVPKNHLIIEFV